MKRNSPFMNRFCILLLTALFSTAGLKAQNLDLLNNKELQELNKLNPSLTGVLNRLRFLGNQSTNTDLGLETRLFKSASHIGFTASFDNLDHIDRKSFNFAYARDFDLSEKLQLKLGGNVDYQIKVFHGGNRLFEGYSFKDFNGFEYKVDSLNINDFDIDAKFFDVGFGGSLLFKNLVMGVNINHINTPDISVQEGIKQLADFELNAQLMGFVKLGQFGMLIPSAIYAKQKDDAFLSGGVSLSYKTFTLNGQYEDLNGQTGYDVGMSLLLRKRHLVNVSYRSNLATTASTKDGIFSATLNTALFKPKKELEGVLDRIKLVY